MAERKVRLRLDRSHATDTHLSLPCGGGWLSVYAVSMGGRAAGQAHQSQPPVYLRFRMLFPAEERATTTYSSHDDWLLRGTAPTEQRTTLDCAVCPA